MHILSNQQIKGYSAHINYQGSLKAHNSTLKEVLRFTSFLGSPKSIAKIKVYQQCLAP